MMVTNTSLYGLLEFIHVLMVLLSESALGSPESLRQLQEEPFFQGLKSGDILLSSQPASAAALKVVPEIVCQQLLKAQICI